MKGKYRLVKGLTVCEELVRQGYMTTHELRLEQAYNRRHIRSVFCILYKVVIVPVVLLMKIIPGLTPIVDKIARSVFIDRAVLNTTEELRRRKLRLEDEYLDKGRRRR